MNDFTMIDSNSSAFMKDMKTLKDMESNEPESSKGCSICGSKMVYIRGKHPGDDRRIVCPTCLAERMDIIRQVVDDDYGKAFEDKTSDKIIN